MEFRQLLVSYPIHHILKSFTVYCLTKFKMALHGICLLYGIIVVKKYVDHHPLSNIKEWNKDVHCICDR